MEKSSTAFVGMDVHKESMTSRTRRRKRRATAIA